MKLQKSIIGVNISMRKAKVDDYVGKLDKINYPSYIESISSGGKKHCFGDKGICVLSGLNGSGKTTAFAAIKQAVGLPISLTDKNKLNTVSLQIKIVLKNKEYTIQSPHMEDKELESLLSRYPGLVTSFDSSSVHEALSFFGSQNNLEELLNQYEEIATDDYSFLNPNEMSSLIGKDYHSVYLRDIELSDTCTYPFFSVSPDGNTKYDVRGMGLGEYHLFYLMWLIERADSDSIMLLDEPDATISYLSCKKLLGFLAEACVKKHISFYCTTHLPYIFSELKRSSVTSVSRSETSIVFKKTSLPTKSLGYPEAHRGYFLVEDNAAEVLLKSLLTQSHPTSLSSFSIVKMNGQGDIMSLLCLIDKNPALSSEQAYIGIFDGDLKNDASMKSQLGKITNANYLFLPGSEPVEKILQRQFRKNLPLFNAYITKHPTDPSILEEAIQCFTGDDYHDWPYEIASYLGVSWFDFFSQIVACWVSLGIECSNQEFISFISSLENLIAKLPEKKLQGC